MRCLERWSLVDTQDKVVNTILWMAFIALLRKWLLFIDRVHRTYAHQCRLCRKQATTKSS
jgi:hypothetical protein